MLWGKTDNQASKPKYVATSITIDSTDKDVVSVANNTITYAGHGFITGDAVVYTSTGAIAGLTTATVYYVIRVNAGVFKLATTLNNANAGTAIDLTDLGTAASSLQKLMANVYLVSNEEATTSEARAKGITGPGWWRYTSYTDANGRVRHKAECLVAMSVVGAAAGDAADDAILPEPGTITIDTQPEAASVIAPATAAFTVVASIDTDSVLAYQWQSSADVGVTWANVVGADEATYTTAATTTADDGVMYRVIVSAAGAKSVTSTGVALTVTE